MALKFNEADRFLVDHWTDARDLEEGMQELRAKYEQVLNEVLSRLQEESWWGTDFNCYANQHYGCVGFGREAWGGKKGNFPGLWLDDLDVDYLTGRSEGHPYAAVWLGRLKTNPADVDTIRINLVRVAGAALSDFPPRSGEKDLTVIRYSLPESREDLLKGLLTEGSKPFIEMCINHMNRLARLIPSIDQVLGVRAAG